MSPSPCFSSLNSSLNTSNVSNYSKLSFIDPDSVRDQYSPEAQKFMSKGANMDRFLSMNSATQSNNNGFAYTNTSMSRLLSMNMANLPKGNVTFGNSSMSGQMASSPEWSKQFPVPNSISQKMFPQPGTRDPQLDSSMQKYSSLNDFTDDSKFRPHQSGPSKYSDSFVFHTTEQDSPIQQVGKQLSLQDINRYMFQGEHSGEPGLPTTHAGSSGQPTFTGTSLTSSPATFDGSAFPSGGVVTGTANQMHLITPNGARPYGPMVGGSGSSSINRPANQSAPSYDLSSGGYNMVYSQPQAVKDNGNKNVSGSAFMPSGTFTPKVADGAPPVQMTFESPEMKVFVKKGGHVSVDNGSNSTTTSPQFQPSAGP